MLTYVDTLIGFAGVMLLFSLVITLLVQATISIFNLRGLSLLWGIALVVERARPGIKNSLEAWELAWQVLTHPALSPHGRLAPCVRSDELARALEEVKAADVDKKLDLRGKALRLMHRARAKETSAEAEVASLKKWFDTVMDRTTERFVARTRLITFVIAAALSFGLHVDAIALLRQISGNPELRARLAQSAEATMKVADEVSARGREGATLASDTLRKAAADNPRVLLGAAIPERLAQRAEGEAWIDANVEDAAGRASFAASYQRRYDEAVQKRLPELYATASKVRAEIAATQLNLLPATHQEWRLGDWRWVTTHHQHLFGVIMSTLFLSLGAPFWYNMLRQLANLRPLLAGKVDQAESPKKDGV